MTLEWPAGWDRTPSSEREGEAWDPEAVDDE